MAKADKKSEKSSKEEKAGKQGKEKKPDKGQNADFSQKKFSGSIALSKLKHVIMTKKGKKGDVRGLFIPIKENFLVEGKGGAVYMAVSVITKSPQDEYGQNGFISQNGNKKWSEASEKEKEKFKALPILGNIKNFEDTQSSSSSDTSGRAGEVDEDDDLPF
jgi:hypothetical protein